MDSMKDKIIDWYANGEVGLSSNAMAYAALGKYGKNKNHPLDPADLDRCLKLLHAVPEIREHMQEISNISQKWRYLVYRWDDLEACFLEEIGPNWMKGWWSAPVTYSLMKEILKDR